MEQNVRSEMANLRLRFKKILNRNNELPGRLQLKRSVNNHHTDHIKVYDFN